MAIQDPAQQMPAAGTLTDLFAVAAGKTSVLSSLVMCNQGDATARVCVSVAPGGVAHDPKHYLACMLVIPARQSNVWTIGITMSALTVLRVQSDTGAVSFSAFRDET